uniref:Uncharacterized protein n=1 Tax=Arundo donax TaxID=35708 RepID=A0A0A8ZHM3_ARUDO
MLSRYFQSKMIQQLRLEFSTLVFHG